MTMVIAGVSGAIGEALARRYLNACPDRKLIGLCREPLRVSADLRQHPGVRLLTWDAEEVERLDEGALHSALNDSGPLRTVLYTAGLLHDGRMFPEKRLDDLNGAEMVRAYHVNCVGFALLIQALTPWLRGQHFKRVAAISAKVGSISDNRLGGWYTYRASKAALNMLVKTLSVELPRRCGPLACVALHPGTTRSALSQPFQQSLQQLNVHEPDDTADHLFTVLEHLSERDNGRFINWDGRDLPW